MKLALAGFVTLCAAGAVAAPITVGDARQQAVLAGASLQVFTHRAACAVRGKAAMFAWPQALAAVRP